jgi:hypothetical protein
LNLQSNKRWDTSEANKLQAYGGLHLHHTWIRHVNPNFLHSLRLLFQQWPSSDSFFGYLPQGKQNSSLFGYLPQGKQNSSLFVLTNLLQCDLGAAGRWK